MMRMHDNRKQTAVFVDLDGTLSEAYLWQGLFAHHRTNRFNLGHLYSFIAVHTPIWFLYKARLVTKEFFHNLHATNLAWLLRGVSVTRAEAIWDWVIQHQIQPGIRPEMVDEIESHKAVGRPIYLISGSFAPILDRLANGMNLAGAIATPLEVKDGRYTGRIIPPINIGLGKVERLQHFLEAQNESIDLSRSYFYTDSSVDKPVMDMFGHPVAVYPDAMLASQAVELGWTIIDAKAG